MGGIVSSVTDAIGITDHAGDAARTAAAQEQAGTQRGVGYEHQALSQLTGEFSPYSKIGLEAFKNQAALSGALGASAQQNALNAMQQSPSQKFIQDREMRALQRTAAAKGMLHSGNTLGALQQQAAGFASQDMQNQMANLRGVAGMGIGALGQLGGYQSQIAGNIANMYGHMGQQQAQGTINAQQARAQESSNLLGGLGTLAGLL